MGVCCGSSQSGSSNKLLRLNTEELGRGKPVVMEVDVRKAGPNPNSQQMLLSSKLASEQGSGVLRWQRAVALQEAGLKPQDLSILSEEDKLVQRYCKRLQISSGQDFGDEGLRSETFTTCCSSGSSGLLWLCSESSGREYTYNLKTEMSTSSPLKLSSRITSSQKSSVTYDQITIG